MAGTRRADMQMRFATASRTDDIRQILELQARNLAAVLSPEARASQGFLTVQHDPNVLRRMNAIAPAIVARAGGQIAGYALVMPREFSAEVPVLHPLFERLGRLSRNSTPLAANARWFVMGQICVAEPYRSTGVFDGLYQTMGEVYRDRFDFTVTEVAERNTRSMRAHERVGFQELHRYQNHLTGESWRVIALDF